MSVKTATKINYRLSGHDSFVCRYSWLPKAIDAISQNAFIFQNEEDAIIQMGVGKNMVKSMKFWVDAMGVVSFDRKNGYSLSQFGNSIFNEKHDPFLEDIKTLWLIHWKLSTSIESPIFAWDYMLNKWHSTDITQSKVIRTFIDETARLNHKVSENTLKKHFSIFIHTYVPSKGVKGEVLEDNLDSPLTELNLIRRVGERKTIESGKNETIYAFNKDDKPEITPELFLYTVLDYKEKYLPNSQKISFNQIANGHGSPGQVFKLPESGIRERLELISNLKNNIIEFRESSNSQDVFVKNNKIKSIEYIKQVYIS